MVRSRSRPDRGRPEPARATRFLATRDTRIAYDDHGAGPPVVLLHPGISDRRVWDPQIGWLVRTHRVVRYDLRGFGESAPAHREYSSVQDLATLLDHLGIVRPLLAGASMGGRIALDYCLERPRAASGLLLLAPALPAGFSIRNMPGAGAALLGLRASAERIETAWRAGEADRAWAELRRVWCPAVRGRSLARWRETVRSNALEVFEDRSERYDLGRSRAGPARPSSLRIPVRLLVGDRDQPLMRCIAETIRRRLPGAELRTVPGADHLIGLSRPRAVAREFAELSEHVRRDEGVGDARGSGVR